MPIWAAVEQKSHQPLLLLMEECVAASTPELQPDSQVHFIISNKGYDSDTGSSFLLLFEGKDHIFFFSCLLESMRGNSIFLPRYHSSALILYLQAFKFPLGEAVSLTVVAKGLFSTQQFFAVFYAPQVYIHCNLVAWDPNDLSESKKTCNYVKETGR